MLNPEYLKEHMPSKLHRMFVADEHMPALKLARFLNEPFYQKVQKALRNCHFKKHIAPLSYSYSTSPLPHLLAELFTSTELLDLLSATIKKKIKKIDASVQLFEWKDYTLLHDSTTEKPGYDIILDVTEDFPEKANGALVYTDGQGTSTALEPHANTLLVVHRKKNIHKFVQYVNHYGKKHKRMLVMGYIM